MFPSTINTSIVTVLIALNTQITAFQADLLVSNSDVPEVDSLDTASIQPDMVKTDLSLARLEYSLNTAGQVKRPNTPKTTITPKRAPQPVISSTPAPTRAPQPIPAPADLEHWFTTYGNAFGVDPNTLKTIARCESGFNSNSQGGPHGGMFQYLASTWSSTRNAMGLDPDPDLRYNAEEAIKTSAWKISVGGIGAWPHCGRQLASASVGQ